VHGSCAPWLITTPYVNVAPAVRRGFFAACVRGLCSGLPLQWGFCAPGPVCNGKGLHVRGRRQKRCVGKAAAVPGLVCGRFCAWAQARAVLLWGACSATPPAWPRFTSWGGGASVRFVNRRGCQAGSAPCCLRICGLPCTAPAAGCFALTSGLSRCFLPAAHW